MSLDLIFAITASIFGPLITGLCSLVVIRMQRKTHAEVKSPNGTRTGETLYNMKLEQQVIKGTVAGLVSLANLTDTRLARLERTEEAAHAADQADRDLKTATVKAALDTAAASPPQVRVEVTTATPEGPSPLVVVQPEVGRPDLSSGGKST